MAKIRVGVLRGGPYSEFEASLQSGANALKYLPRNKYELKDILWTKDGIWHLDGFPLPPEKLAHKIDVVFNALHGRLKGYKKAEQSFKTLGLPVTGSDAVSAAAAGNKIISRKIFESHGLKVPHAVVVSRLSDRKKMVSTARETLFPWWVIKPAQANSALQILAKSEPEIVRALDKIFETPDCKEALIEENLDGRVASGGVLENFHGQKYYALPVVEICDPKRGGMICPGRFDKATTDKIKESSIVAHQALGCRHYSRTEFTLSKRGIYINKANALPKLTPEACYPEAANVAGLSFKGLLEHLISEARK
ncbi:hypothetical protein HYW53_00265 [Candidatus Giovannonibacteria bacterium]|nr:hypothetical protein [Candidatus Giovannonibacteria bacterium]